MAKGNEIIVTANPKGHFEEVIVDGTPKPGTVMVIKPGQTATSLSSQGGRWEYEPAGTTAASGAMGMGADGNRVPIAVLLEDHLQGRLATTAYVDGDRARVYYPIMGEELNMLKLDVSGTADDFAVGTPLIVDDGTGQVLISSGSPEAEPFISLEVLTDPTADQLVWCKFTGY